MPQTMSWMRPFPASSTSGHGFRTEEAVGTYRDDMRKYTKLQEGRTSMSTVKGPLITLLSTVAHVRDGKQAYKRVRRNPLRR